MENLSVIRILQLILKVRLKSVLFFYNFKLVASCVIITSCRAGCLIRIFEYSLLAAVEATILTCLQWCCKWLHLRHGRCQLLSDAIVLCMYRCILLGHTEASPPTAFLLN